MVEEQHQIREEDEIDLVALIQTVWAGRRTIFKFILIFGLIGLFIAIFSPKEYTAKTIMIPDFSKTDVNGNLGGLASLAGIDLATKGSSDIIPYTLYPKIVESLPFKRELAKTKLKISELDYEVSFEKYYTEIHRSGVLAWVKKYTLGLPRVIINSFKGKPQKNSPVLDDESLIFISNKDQSVYSALSSKISIEINDKDGYIQIEGRMPEAIPAAQLTLRAQELLQNYIVDFKSKKAVQQLRFIEDRYKEKEKEFRKAELNLARFQDQNKNVISAQAATKEKKLLSEYTLTYNIYSDLAKQIEQQKIKVKEDAPVFTIIEPVSVPVEKSKPRRLLILAIWFFLGGALGVGVIFFKDFIDKCKKI